MLLFIGSVNIKIYILISKYILTIQNRLKIKYKLLLIIFFYQDGFHIASLL